MARTGVTYEQVKDVAELLTKAGESPTIEKVRLELGGTGSYSTLSRHIKQWRSETSALSQLTPMPIDIEVKNTFDNLLKQVQSASEKEHQEERNKLQEAANDLQQQLAEKTKAHEEDRIVIKNMADQLNQSEMALSILSKAMEQLTQELEHWKSQYSTANNALAKAEQTYRNQQIQHQQDMWSSQRRWENALSQIRIQNEEWVNKIERENERHAAEVHNWSLRLSGSQKQYEALDAKNKRYLQSETGKTARISNLEKQLLKAEEALEKKRRADTYKTMAIDHLTEAYWTLLYCLYRTGYTI